MKEQAFHQGVHQTVRFEASVLLVLFVFVLFSAIGTHSTAQQNNRQLNRDQTQPNGASARRVALVIGNGAYSNAPQLKNPPNDARDMAATLRTLGFEVASGINVNQREIKTLIRDFGQKLKVGGSGLFYYAGHGVQSKGRNYLIPVEADIQSEAEVEDAGVDVNLVLNYMDDAQNGVNIVILDACRNNPFSRSFRSASNGLAQVDAPTGTLIAYATAPGRVASDGIGQNGLYTSELLKQMRVPGLSATEMFMHVRAEVMKQTDNKQVPWEASSLVGTFYFSAPAKDGASPPTSAVVNETKIDPVAVEREYWESIRNSTSPQDYRDYLTSYPNGAYSAIAKTKLRQLEAPKNEANYPQFVGGWKNVDGNTNSFTRIEIQSDANSMRIHMWAKCSGGTGKDCDQGEVSRPLSDANNRTISITWNQGFKVTNQQLGLLPDGRLRVTSHVQFTDNSGRPTRDFTDYFSKTTGNPTQSGDAQQKAPENDIGKSKANDSYEITLENASASSNPVHLDICNFNVPSGQKAITVRFAIRLSPPLRLGEELLRLGYTQTTDFVLTDDRGRRVDPECLVTGMVLSADGRAVNRTLAYLVPVGSQHLSFRFQKSGAGRPIVFGLSGLD